MIFVDQNSIDSFLFNNLLDSGIPFKILEKGEKPEDIKSNIILRPKKDTYCHPCPGTKVYNCCNYFTADVMEGCPFDCSYCILQAYLDHKDIQVSSDVNTILSSIKEVCLDGKKRRLGTGELSDSLALDHIFPYSKIIVPEINKQDNIQFEFKTKSANISNILNLNPKNIVVSWSINPPSVVKKHETGSAPVDKRIAAASECVAAGFKVGFHFDPMIYFEGYEKEYESIVAKIMSTIPEHSVEYISISTFRGPAPLIDAMRERHEVPDILQGDFVQALDGKTRYFKPLRMEMIKTVAGSFRDYWKNVFIYLCMESIDVWEYALGISPGTREETELLFPWSSSL